MRPRPGPPANAATEADRAEVLSRVSRETAVRLDRYVALLLKWQARINLISPATVPELWKRHILDSMRLFELAPETRHWVDLGSGGGLPGIVLGILSGDGAHVELVESNAKKAAFLRAALLDCGVGGQVHAKSIETCGQVIAGAEAVTARALAPLDALLGLVAPWLATGAACYFPKGRNHRQEIDEAADNWRFTMIEHAMGEGSVVLEVRDIQTLPRLEDAPPSGMVRRS